MTEDDGGTLHYVGDREILEALIGKEEVQRLEKAQVTMGPGGGESHTQFEPEHERSEEPFSPENPAMGGVDTGLEHHPNREDWEKEQERLERIRLSQMVAPQPFRRKVKGFFRRLANVNNAIRFPAWNWAIIFVVWWIAMLMVYLITVSGMSAIYMNLMASHTFDFRVASFLFNVGGMLLVPVFPIYLLFYGIMSFAESGDV